MLTDKILLETGTYFELFEYKNPIEVGTKKILPTTNDTPKQPTESINLEYAKKSALRAKNKLRRLILGNMHQQKKHSLKFITLTFKDEIEDIEIANYEFKKYHQRMSYKMKEPLSYIAVPEIQEKRKIETGKAVWHFHMLTMNQPFYPNATLKKLWGNGFTDPRKCNRVEGTANYVSKYLAKAYGNQLLKNRKRYYNGLTHQTISHKNPTEIRQFLPQLFEKTNQVNQYPLYASDADGIKHEVGTKKEFVILK